MMLPAFSIIGIGEKAYVANVPDDMNANATSVSKDISSCTIAAIANQTYTGSAITPSVTVKDGDTVLTESTDYTLSYANNTNAGTATVTVTGKGNYTGTTTATFKVVISYAAKRTVGASGSVRYKVLMTGTSGGTLAITAPASKTATSVTIPSSIKVKGLTYKVTSIAPKAFYKNTKITKLTVSSTILTAVGAKAFYGCKNLKAIKFSSTRITSVSSYAFKGTYAKVKVYVPRAKARAYKKLFLKRGLSKKAIFKTI